VAEDYLNIDNVVQTGAALKTIDEAFENRLQIRKKNVTKEKGKEEGISRRRLEDCKLKSYRDPLQNVRELQDFPLIQNNSELFHTYAERKYRLKTKVLGQSFTRRNNEQGVMWLK
jgi:hypothetical protein